MLNTAYLFEIDAKSWKDGVKTHFKYNPINFGRKKMNNPIPVNPAYSGRTYVKNMNMG